MDTDPIVFPPPHLPPEVQIPRRNATRAHFLVIKSINNL